MSIMFQLTK